MNEEEYLKQRLDDQINWYGDKSKTNKNWFKSLHSIEIICAAIIPFVAGFSDKIPYSEVLIGFLGIVIAACAGLTALNKFQENWIVYRTTAETLKHEKYLYMTKSKPYDGSDSFQILV